VSRMHAEAVPSSIEGIHTDLFELIIWSVFCVQPVQTGSLYSHH
jgi:hypothetical protein